jgi:hypothetical protein
LPNISKIRKNGCKIDKRDTKFTKCESESIILEVNMKKLCTFVMCLHYIIYKMQQGRKIVEPAYLKAGDKVAIVSPAYWISQDAIQMAANVIRS